MTGTRGLRLGISLLGLMVLPSLVGHGSHAQPLPLTPNWSFESNRPNSQAGYWSSAAGDVNGDGYDDVLVGALVYDNPELDEGAVFLFLGSSSGLSATPEWTFECNQAGARCGEMVNSAGDVNGDGYDDVLVAAPYYDNDQINEGRASLFLGSPGGLSPTPSWVQEGNQTGGAYGFASGAGDVNGDGFDDVIVAAHFYDNPETDEGRAFLYLGSAAGLSTTPSWTAETDQAGAVLIAFAAGDVNGDGFDDVILGSRQYNLGRGKVFLYLGSPSGPGAAPFWTAEGDQAGAQFGFIPGSADVNDDGYADVLVIADSYDHPETNEGAAFLWLGGPSGKILQGINGTPSNADWSAEGNQSFAYLRWGAGAGDVDADGFDDVAVGLGLYTVDQVEEGRVLVFRGTASGLELAPAWSADGNSNGARLGWTVDGAGDVNGDGFGDILAGAERFSNGQPGEGAAFVYHGTGSAPCVDTDGDGYGLVGSVLCPGGGALDCNDTNAAVHPGAPEICDAVDDDCDEVIDEGNPGGGLTCDTGRPGACAAGQTTCQEGSLTCAPLTAGSPEVCDAVDNDCDDLVDEGVRIQATASSTPSTLNVNSQGSSFTVNLSLIDVCDPSQTTPIAGDLLERTYVSRAGQIVLPDPASIACPDADGSVLFERGISDDPQARNVSGSGATLRFNVASDGNCTTLDGDRQDLIALLADLPDNSVALVCIAGRADGANFESCTPVTVRNRGNR